MDVQEWSSDGVSGGQSGKGSASIGAFIIRPGFWCI